MRTVFLKLGGSLITDKRVAETARLDVIKRLAWELANVRKAAPELRLVIGHGSGSFGHIHAQRYATRSAVVSAEQWYGFAVTADAAARLNRIVVRALLDAGIPAWGIQPSVVLRCQDGSVLSVPDETVELALDRGLQPVVYGDVALDEVRGGTIASTEEIFARLAVRLHPQRLVLAGEVDGIYSSDPLLDHTAERIPVITRGGMGSLQASLGASHGVDVTGGMAAKVAQSLAITARQRGSDVVVCSGLIEGNLFTVLTDPDSSVGTRIYEE